MIFDPEEPRALQIPFKRKEIPEHIYRQYTEWVTGAIEWEQAKPVVIVGYQQKVNRNMRHYLIAELRNAGVPKDLQYYAMGHLRHMARYEFGYGNHLQGLGRGGPKRASQTPVQIDDILSIDFTDMHKDLRPPNWQA